MEILQGIAGIVIIIWVFWIEKESRIKENK